VDRRSAEWGAGRCCLRTAKSRATPATTRTWEPTRSGATCPVHGSRESAVPRVADVRARQFGRPEAALHERGQPERHAQAPNAAAGAPARAARALVRVRG
jgi:hypothetical protein